MMLTAKPSSMSKSFLLILLMKKHNKCTEDYNEPGKKVPYKGLVQWIQDVIGRKNHSLAGFNRYL
ncbi:hypothetical protein NMY3_02862 [Candidatus Nitrosocosmicus oleophilus]|jgi:hypothetical protein|uniref:Uncharacterized protein n=1 Tax=Candidatus Nitrosocosmicus oleophilus TaxID=1353260 RepID=A0A654M3E0_9ARCH|nr:hypothetical protein NMY3_02862 [Candidatus Nitrosocosmicus oleophilus]